MDKFPQKKFNAVVSKVEVMAQGVKRITFKVSEPFDFLAWQYVWIEIPKMSIGDSKGSRRAFSIYNTKNKDNTIEILARISESGYKQSLFALQNGDPVFIHGPFGNSFIVEETHQPKHIIMIAGGVGIAAFYPMIKTIKEKKYPVQSFLVYLNKSKEVTPCLKDLAALKRGNKFFDYSVKYEHFVWKDVAEVAQKFGENTEWWISGTQGMVDFVFKELETGGVSRSSMVFENFYPTVKNNLTREMLAGQLKDENNIFIKALQNSTNHTVITDTQGVILFANKASEFITGYTKEEMLGNTPRLWGGMMSREFYVDFWKRKSSGEAFEGEIVNRRKNGEIYYTVGHISPIKDLENNIIGYIGTEEDITEIKKQQNKIEESEQRLKFALEGSRDVLWDWNIITNEVYFSPRWKEMLGFKDNEIQASLNEWEKRVHPEDLKEVERVLTEHLEGRTQFYESKHRVLCKDGTYKWILDRGIVTERDAAGKAMRAVGTHTDITEIKEREMEMERLNKLMVGRELKMIELKEKLEKLSKK